MTAPGPAAGAHPHRAHLARSSTAAAIRSSARSATRAEVWATIVRDGHEVLGAALRYRPPGARRWREAPMRAIPAGSRSLARLVHAGCARALAVRRRRVGRSRRVLAARARAQGRGRAERSRERAVRGRRAARRAGADRRGRPRRARPATAPSRPSSDGDARDHGRQRARDVRLLVRALPALVGRLRRRREAAARVREARLRRALPAARAPDRARRIARAATTPRPRAAPTRAARGRSASEAGGHTALHPDLGSEAEFASLIARASRARHRDRARLRAPVLARPPLAARAPGLVPPPARRHAQVRREPAQALPGHLQPQLRHRGLAGALGGAARRRPALGRAAASPCSGSTTRTRSRSRSGSG